MAKLKVPDSRNAVLVAGGFGTFQSYFTAFFASLADRFTAVDGVAAVASADAAAAPGAYNQAHIQTIVAELNETKQKLNALLTALKQ